MSHSAPPVRGLARNRHGRAIRRPLISPRLKPGTVRRGGLTEIVEDAVYFLKLDFPEELDKLTVRIQDLPPARAHVRSTKWSYLPVPNVLTFYRIPLSYSGRRRDPLLEAYRLNWEVVQAIATVLGRDPKDLWDGPR